MKFKFEEILDPTIDPTNRDAVLGHFADGTTIKVERHMDGWNVNLRITVNNTLWHDNKVEPDEIRQVETLRQSAFNNASIKRDNARAVAIERANMWLLGLRGLTI